MNNEEKFNKFVNYLIVAFTFFFIGVTVEHCTNKRKDNSSSPVGEIVKVDSLIKVNDSLKLEVKQLDSIKDAKVIEVKSLDNDSTARLFYQLISR